MLTSASALPGAHSTQIKRKYGLDSLHTYVVVSDEPKGRVTSDLLVTCFIHENILINWLKVFQMHTLVRYITSAFHFIYYMDLKASPHLWL